MRIDLALQRVKPGFKKQTLLLFQLHLNAREVPDLDGDGDGCYRGGKARQQSDRSADGKHPQPLGRRVVQLQARGLKGDNHQEKCGLPVDARMAQVAPDPAIYAEIDEGRERPYLFFITAKMAQ